MSHEFPAGAEAAAPVYEVEMHPWYKPLYPVILVLTGRDHLRDTHLLLVFYLQQLIEGAPLPLLFSAFKLILMHVGAPCARATHPPPVPRWAFARHTPLPPPHPAVRRAYALCLIPFSLFVGFLGAGTGGAGGAAQTPGDALVQDGTLALVAPAMPLLKTAVAEKGETSRIGRANTVFMLAPLKLPGLLMEWVAALALPAPASSVAVSAGSAAEDSLAPEDSVMMSSFRPLVGSQDSDIVGQAASGKMEISVAGQQ
ncbi:hypothetical protein FB451DRAFT_1417310 [Mycena latifolia]|nr:hypothetical protein FB451DRAFT_1417310 [Mycena latifolia]